MVGETGFEPEINESKAGVYRVILSDEYVSFMSSNIEVRRSYGVALADSDRLIDLFSKWSGRQDLNLRPSAPKADALPGCATPRFKMSYFGEKLDLI